MASTSPHSVDSRQVAAAIQLPSRLRCCWECDLDWELIPPRLKQVGQKLVIAVLCILATSAYALYSNRLATKQLNQSACLPLLFWQDWYLLPATQCHILLWRWRARTGLNLY